LSDIVKLTLYKRIKTKLKIWGSHHQLFSLQLPKRDNDSIKHGAISLEKATNESLTLETIVLDLDSLLRVELTLPSEVKNQSYVHDRFPNSSA